MVFNRSLDCLKLKTSFFAFVASPILTSITFWKQAFKTAALFVQSSLFENLLLKKFSRVIVVYCSIIKVLFAVLFKRQLLYSIKSFSLCQELFYFSVSFDLAFSCPPLATACLYYHIQIILSTTFFDWFSIFPITSNQECPASASSLLFRSFVALSAVPQRRMYLTMPVLNCQYFLYFSCNSEYSDNSIYVCKTISFTIITDTALYSRKFFQEPKESARIWQNAHGFFHGFIL